MKKSTSGKRSFSTAQRPGSQDRGFSRPGRDSRDGFRRDNRREEPYGRTGKTRADYMMHKVICTSCGEECEVPFRPTSSKPVYCSDCFKKEDRRKPAGNERRHDELDQINRKLDKIMRALKIE